MHTTTISFCFSVLVLFFKFGICFTNVKEYVQMGKKNILSVRVPTKDKK